MTERELTRMLPAYYQTSKVVAAVNGAGAAELNRLDERFDTVLRQFFVSTADFSLERWERELGLEVNGNSGPEVRRSRILSKLQGSGTVTVRLVKSVAESFTGTEAEVIERCPEYRFTVKFVGNIGVPPNIDALRAALEDCKPAHLGLELAFRWRTHGELRPYTHRALAGRTHAELRGGIL